MKGNEKNILLGAVVVAALLVLAAWKFIYSADMEKIDQLQGEINTLQVRMDELNAKSANRPLYEQGISDSKDIIDTVLSLYGPGNTPEKTIMMIVDLCKKTGASVSDIAFEENKLIYATEATADDPGIQIYKGGLSMNVSSGYTQFKKITDYINSYPERMNAENFNVAFSGETGKLNITMNVNLYSVTDKNHKYEAPVIEDIEISTPNIFKTLELTQEEETEEGTEEDSISGNTPSAEENNSATEE
ncbi:MAG: hypothetical protein K6E47_12165 [Lachnospiraceae bacterium]|nr:hypothetical protein [Lachnospiraceae bacterium]